MKGRSPGPLLSTIKMDQINTRSKDITADKQNLTHHHNNSQSRGSLTLNDLKRRAKSGRAADIDCLMSEIDMSQTLSRCKAIDFALGLVCSDEGRDRIRYFLFNGSQIQRNHAALYFKRRGNGQIITEAVRHGCIDDVQAYSK